MGILTYGSKLTIDFDDRVLAHIEIVIGAKLRRGEPFHFSWVDSRGGGQSTIWVQPAIPFSYKYLGARVPSLNRRWVEALMTAANSSGGLRLVPEPPEAS